VEEEDASGRKVFPHHPETAIVAVNTPSGFQNFYGNPSWGHKYEATRWYFFRAASHSILTFKVHVKIYQAQ